ncbi:hypothetical protein [Pyrobaculum neutrophilum]|uniref:Uncharacterized protein n=1 Tax=Pyrobaculum neutrophilum (strain DSM 2338 / JCM 9278 / NBRC 100436 / V24Sta) TaxID=444157 RepID=B1YDR0_PYRNV|nr:hypothetical protein [Pyrobaculum neutrophilum]ACB39923.1 conserved hypothetical protein [Pyrobaculum neutrophilum V24Sta]
MAENLIAAVLGKAAEEALETAVQAYLQKKISRKDFQTALLLVIVKMMGDMNKKLDIANKRLDDVNRKLDDIKMDVAAIKENMARAREELLRVRENIASVGIRI